MSTGKNALAEEGSCTTRDPRVAEAVRQFPAIGFPALTANRRDFGDDFLVRLIEDLSPEASMHVLIVEPSSARLSAVVANLAMAVTVACADPRRAEQLREQLRAASVENVWVTALAARGDDEPRARFERVVVVASDQITLGPMFRDLLTPDGCAIWPLDRSSPPRHMRRLMRVEGAEDLEEDLDFVRFMPLLGDLLVEAGCVLRQEIAEAMVSALQNGRRIGEELLLRGAVREDDLYRMLAEQRRMLFTRTGDVLKRLDVELVQQLPRKFLDHYRFLPMPIIDGVVHVITSDADLPTWELHSIFEHTEIVAELVTPTDLTRIWTAIDLGFVQSAADQRASNALPVAAAPLEELKDLGVEESRAVGMFDAILLDAITERTSDIHLERYQTDARLRFRVDGSLRDVDRYKLTNEDFVALLNVVKIAADLDIAERRLPQGGRIRRHFGGKAYDLRVQTQPTLFSESVVIRILPQDRRPPSIEELGFQADAADSYRRLLSDPQGLILVVGATGSGKSTTLYAGLQLLAKDTSRKVLTIEDPIEFSLAGIQQTQVNAAVGFRFADAVRSFVRQDPDVILVGEIRDQETALEAIRAAQTGHLVLATLHCNDSVDAVQRLSDLGMSRNSIASELTAVISQRLARRICTGCRTPSLPDSALVADLFPHGAPSDFKCFEGSGCDRCRGAGTYGRVAVVEFLRVDATIRRAIASGSATDDLRELAARSDMRTLRDSAIELVNNGVIPLKDLYDVLSEEQMRGLS